MVLKMMALFSVQVNNLLGIMQANGKISFVLRRAELMLYDLNMMELLWPQVTQNLVDVMSLVGPISKFLTKHTGVGSNSHARFYASKSSIYL